MGSIVPQLSLFVLAAFRLLPAVARFTGYVNQIIYFKPSIDAVYVSLFEENENPAEAAGGVASRKSPDIVVEGLFFKYPEAQAHVIENVSLSIPHKKSVAFIGPTGAGKTTLADIILGVYAPQSGYVFHNGKSIHHDPGEWTNLVGYVPQQIYMLDESIRENVSFGVPKDEVDEVRVWGAIEKARLKDFVESLPDKLDTIIGDRGVRLSGGQRQRIGIARALYNNPEILVLDEATSSLDDETEKAVMEAIETFRGEKTMIIIAHRLSTIEHCDVVYKVENKKVVKEK